MYADKHVLMYSDIKKFTKSYFNYTELLYLIKENLIL